MSFEEEGTIWLLVLRKLRKHMKGFVDELRKFVLYGKKMEGGVKK
ncbi:hypothetical protein [Bacillus pumilus]|nr:hypothetical protein [Bacillus pumilus]